MLEKRCIQHLLHYCVTIHSKVQVQGKIMWSCFVVMMMIFRTVQQVVISIFALSSIMNKIIKKPELR